MSGPRIERIDPTDRRVADELVPLQRAAYAVEAELIGFDGIPPLHETVDELVGAGLQWWAIRHDSAIVAAIATTVTGRVCDIDRLVVHPASHRHGFGRALVQHVLHHEVVTVSTGSHNVPARALYEQLHFRVIGTREVSPGVTVTAYEHWHHRFATSFDDDVANYEAARPPYPDALWALLRDRVGVGAGTSVLEIGAGPGSATMHLLDLGARVTAVEPGANMVARLRERTAGRDCTVVPGRFEDVELSGGFDVVCSATAFHWTDAAVSVPKVADQLVPGGRVALWWNLHGRADGVDDVLHRAIQPIADRFGLAQRKGVQPYALDTEARWHDLGRDARLEPVEHTVFDWPHTHTPESARALFASFSDWSTLPEPARTEALDGVAAAVAGRPGATVTLRYATAVYVARRVSR